MADGENGGTKPDAGGPGPESSLSADRAAAGSGATAAGGATREEDTPSDDDARKTADSPPGGATGVSAAESMAGAREEPRDFSEYRVQPSLDKEYSSITSSSNKETADSLDFLAESKDRAQVSATSALSLSLIVILKELLDQDFGSKYRTVSLVFVGLCLLLQVTIGLLAIYMYQLKAKMNVFKKRAELRQSLLQNDVFYLESEGPDRMRLGETKAPAGAQNPESVAAPEPRRDQVGIIRATPKPPPNSDLRDLDSSMLQAITDQYAQVLMDIQKLQIRLVSAEPPEVDALKVALRKKLDVLKLLGAQIQLLELRQNIASKRDTLARMASIQNAITYLLYITFVINAFLTGFGISTSGAAPSQVQKR